MTGADASRLPEDLERPGDIGFLGRMLDGLGTAACVVDADERMRSWNRTFEAFFPEQLDQLRVGLAYEDNLRRYFGRNVVGVTPEQLGEYVRTGLERHRRMREPLIFQKKDGRWLRSQIHWFPGGECLKTWTDITELQVARFNAASGAEASAVYNIGVAQYDAAGRFVTANRKMSDLFPHCVDLFRGGATYRAHLASHAEHVIGRADLPRFRRLIERPDPVAAPLEDPAVFRTRSGGWLRLEEHRTFDGGLSSIWVDVTELRELNEANAALNRQTEELRRLTRELAEARDAALAERNRAEEASRAKSTFLAMMSHELRTPLNAVIGFSELMRHELFGTVGARYRDYAEDISRAGRHLLSMINDILDLSKIEAGEIVMHPEPVDADAAAAECVAMVETQAQDRRLTLDVTIAPDLPPIHADRRALCQMIVNLLSNACKFTPAGGSVHLAIAPAPGGGIELAVTDTGIGMNPAEIEVALELFGQVDNLMTRSQEGTGLGLPMVKRLAELHGGMLQVRSAPGEGTIVTVFLPPAPAAPAPPVAADAPQPAR